MQGKAPSPANQPWEQRAITTLRELAQSRMAFTSEDITDKIGYPNSNTQNANNKIGLFIQRHAQKYGLVRLRMERARHPQSNGRLITVWIGKA